MTFKVTLSKPSTAPISVDYATEDGSAVQGEDYTTRTGTLNFDPGEKSKTVKVPVLGDRVAESTETFEVDLTNPVGADITDPSVTGTINDNDAAVG